MLLIRTNKMKPQIVIFDTVCAEPGRFDAQSYLKPIQKDVVKNRQLQMSISEKLSFSLHLYQLAVLWKS